MILVTFLSKADVFSIRSERWCLWRSFRMLMLVAFLLNTVVCDIPSEHQCLWPLFWTLMFMLRNSGTCGVPSFSSEVRVETVNTTLLWHCAALTTPTLSPHFETRSGPSEAGCAWWLELGAGVCLKACNKLVTIVCHSWWVTREWLIERAKDCSCAPFLLWRISICRCCATECYF